MTTKTLSERLHLLDHPVAGAILTELRDERTPPPRFRELVALVTPLLLVGATRDLPTRERSVRTPVGDAEGLDLAARLALVPILRAGLGMVEAVHRYLPQAAVWHLGLYRDESTLQPVRYYRNFRGPVPDVALVLEPMLATGGSAIAATVELRAAGVADVRFLSVIAAPEGVDVLLASDPGVRIVAGVLDHELNEDGYIVPGLGDAGDRQYDGTG